MLLYYHVAPLRNDSNVMAKQDDRLQSGRRCPICPMRLEGAKLTSKKTPPFAKFANKCAAPLRTASQNFAAVLYLDWI